MKTKLLYGHWTILTIVICILLTLAVSAESLPDTPVSTIAPGISMSKFDHTVYKTLDSYSYDSADNEWSIQGTTSVPMPVVGTLAFGDDKGINRIILIVASDKTDSIMNGIDFLLDGTEYSYELVGEELNDGSIALVIIGKQGARLFEALASAHDINVCIRYQNGTHDEFNPDSNNFESFLTVVKCLIENNFSEYMSSSCLSESALMEILQPLTITE